MLKGGLGNGFKAFGNGFSWFSIRNLKKKKKNEGKTKWIKAK